MEEAQTPTAPEIGKAIEISIATEGSHQKATKKLDVSALSQGSNISERPRSSKSGRPDLGLDLLQLAKKDNDSLGSLLSARQSQRSDRQ